jgi:hypothetical protein
MALGWPWGGCWVPTACLPNGFEMALAKPLSRQAGIGRRRSAADRCHRFRDLQMWRGLSSRDRGRRDEKERFKLAVGTVNGLPSHFCRKCNVSVAVLAIALRFVAHWFPFRAWWVRAAAEHECSLSVPAASRSLEQKSHCSLRKHL